MSEPAASERVVLVTVALGSMLVLLNSTMIAVALPRLVDAFDDRVGAGRSCSVGSPGCRRIGGRRRGAHP